MVRLLNGQKGRKKGVNAKSEVFCLSNWRLEVASTEMAARWGRSRFGKATWEVTIRQPSRVTRRQWIYESRVQGWNLVWR